MFNPDEFLNATHTESNDTRTTPCPEGEFLAVIEKITPREWTSKKDPSKSGIALDVFWNIEDADVKAQLEREKVTVKQGIMLDFTQSGALDFGQGRNIQLGKLREACELNTPGTQFAFNMLPGRMAKVRVKHRVDGENIYPEISGVVKA